MCDRAYVWMKMIFAGPGEMKCYLIFYGVERFEIGNSKTQIGGLVTAVGRTRTCNKCKFIRLKPEYGN